MAEMTAQEAIAWLTDEKAFGQECYSRKQIAQLIEQQQQKIEQLRLYRGCLECQHNQDGHKNSISCQGKNCVDFNKWQGVE